MQFVSEQHGESGFVLCTKSTQKQFCHFCTSRQGLDVLFDHFFLHCSIILTLYVYFSIFIKRFRAWLVTNFDKRFHELEYKLNKIPDFLKIQSWIILHHAQTQANMMDSWETMYIISVGMLWYDNCAINICSVLITWYILYWPVHYKRATDSNQPVFELNPLWDIIFFDLYPVYSVICEVVSLLHSLIYTVCTVIRLKVLCFCFDLTLYWTSNL